MRFTLTPSLVLAAILSSASLSVAFPAYGSLGGLSDRDLSMIVPNLPARIPTSPPGPPSFTGTKLVDDPAHPFKRLRKGDIRGPCPGLNTLASHGYLPRDGVAKPAEMIIAVQEGFNMENRLARFTTYAAHLVDGNLVTDLLSIGEKTKRTGSPAPAPPAGGGLNQHGTFEGDASMTRGDAFFGDNFNFNQALFNQFKEYSQRFGNGFYNYTVGGELRFQRIQQSLATNPEFNLAGLRHLTAYAEATFPANFFVDGRKTGSEKGQLDMKSAESFFKDMHYPKGFFRPAQPSGTEGIQVIFGAHPTQPGRNVGAVNNFVVDESLGSLLDQCTFYTGFVNRTVKALYPNPSGVLLRNLKLNLGFFYNATGLTPSDCPEVFPYGR